MTKPLLTEHHDGVDRVTLNRPDSLNALDPGMIDAQNAYFVSLQRNRGTRVAVLKGAGSAAAPLYRRNDDGFANGFAVVEGMPQHER